MNGDFTGMATATAPFRVLGRLVEDAMDATCRVGERIRQNRQRRREASTPLSLAPEVVGAIDRAVKTGRLASSSARKYRAVIARFVSGLNPPHMPPVGPAQVERFLDEREFRRVGCGARRVDLAALRTVFDTLLGNDFTAGFTYPARPAPVPPSRVEEVEKVFAAAADDRDRLILLLLNAAKLRPGQIASLTLSRIDRRRGSIIIPKRKSGQYEERVLPERARKLLDNLLASRDAAATKRQWLFESPRNPDAHLTVRAIQKRLHQLADNCGVATTPTMLRKADSLWSQPADMPASSTAEAMTSEIAKQPQSTRIPTSLPAPLNGKSARRSGKTLNSNQVAVACFRAPYTDWQCTGSQKNDFKKEKRITGLCQLDSG